MNNNGILKLVLAVGFLLCLFDMPYWYYQVVRLLGTAGMAYLAWEDYQIGKKQYALVYGIAALLLNPFYKIAFGRTMWNTLDILFALYLLADVFVFRRDSKK